MLAVLPDAAALPPKATLVHANVVGAAAPVELTAV